MFQPLNLFSHFAVVRGTAMAEYKELEEPLDHSDPYPEFNSFADWVYAVKVDRAIVVSLL